MAGTSRRGHRRDSCSDALGGSELHRCVCRPPHLSPVLRVVVATSVTGTPALDVDAAVRIELERAQVRLIESATECTACVQDRFWSHRARGDEERQALVVWIGP
ncbi:MAG: hypothetical protein EBX39_03985 [Actinobacteria bacterium]|nr:hypothetical protein [Actinomycetota bacterium]